jgi:hypothetical protein
MTFVRRFGILVLGGIFFAGGLVAEVVRAFADSNVTAILVPVHSSVPEVVIGAISIVLVAIGAIFVAIWIATRVGRSSSQGRRSSITRYLPLVIGIVVVVVGIVLTDSDRGEYIMIPEGGVDYFALRFLLVYDTYQFVAVIGIAVIGFWIARLVSRRRSRREIDERNTTSLDA